MDVDVNGTRLWFDVDGSALVPDRSQMRQRPTVVLVHGGPGVYDYSYFKPDFGRLAEHAQVVYLDLRGHGRSDWGDAGAWSFETCADDVRIFCDTVGIARPIVLGHSMGGPVVLLYGARHPGHAAGLVVQSGFARWDTPRLVEGFRRVAGDRTRTRRGVGSRNGSPSEHANVDEAVRDPVGKCRPHSAPTASGRPLRTVGGKRAEVIRGRIRSCRP